MNCGLIVSSISAHCMAQNTVFHKSIRLFFLLSHSDTKQLATCFQLLHTNTYWQGLNILTFVLAYRHWIVSCILKDNNTKFLPKPFYWAGRIETYKCPQTTIYTRLNGSWIKKNAQNTLLDYLMDDKTFLIKANYMEKSYSVSYLLILSHLQKM